MDFNNCNGFVPVEDLTQYGEYAVLGTATTTLNTNIPLQWIGGSGSANTLSARLLGSLSAITPPQMNVVVTVLMPNSICEDSAFYRAEQYVQLTEGNTRVHLNVKYLSNSAVNAYGYYTGNNPEWQRIPVIAAQARGEQLVADMGNGIEILWTPAVDTNAILRIPALEGATLAPGAWVFPPTEQADKIRVNPVHPPGYQDAIIWFPSTDVQPIYIWLSVMGDHKYHLRPEVLTAFPDATRVKLKTSARRGGKKRARWKDSKGRIYEWDSQHGTVEIYDKQGKHLGKFNAETGKQSKPAKPNRVTQK